MALSAEQFVVRRGEAPTILAGYPWFTDWGRDTLIALPGLRLAPDDQLAILRLLARHQREGLIPAKPAKVRAGSMAYSTPPRTMPKA